MTYIRINIANMVLFEKITGVVGMTYILKGASGIPCTFVKQDFFTTRMLYKLYEYIDIRSTLFFVTSS
jgi:hypothetical protein